MSALSRLKLVSVQAERNSPTVLRRAKLTGKLEDQIAAAKAATEGGIYVAKRMKTVKDDESGDHYADSADIDDEGAMARRTFWRVAATDWSDDFLVYGGRKGVQGYCEDRAESAAHDDDGNAFLRAAADGNLDDYRNGARATAPAPRPPPAPQSPRAPRPAAPQTAPPAASAPASPPSPPPRPAATCPPRQPHLSLQPARPHLSLQTPHLSLQTPHRARRPPPSPRSRAPAPPRSG